MGFLRWVGIDWAMQAHRICVLGEDGRLVAERSVDHTGTALGEFADWLTQLSSANPAETAVAIEVPHGAVVEALVERGFAVFAINPKQLDRFRDRHTVAGAKDDRRDALVLADSLRTDAQAFHRVRLDDPLLLQIREFSRIEEELGREANRLSNQMLIQLHRFYPQMLHLCPAANEPWLWDLLKLAPTPAAAQKLRPSRVEKLLREHRIRRLTTDDVLEELRSAPLPVAPGVVESASAHVALLLPRLRLAHSQRTECARRVERLLEEIGAEGPEEHRREHRDVEILRSLPGIGRVVAATMLAEASQPLAERNYHALRSHAGIAPVTKQSGKRKAVVMRYACNPRLRNALYHWARVSSRHDPSTKAHYLALRQRGHSAARAWRGVADRLLRILVSMLVHQTLYDPNHRLSTRPA
jgi:transposase